jgi:UDP-N-acetylmuramyl pentapeptide phosphotransferase/UDP-N-acetylglucosamine-1-phosphate transferase
LHLLPLALAAFIAAAILTRLMIPWLAARGALAHENNRTMHTGIVPKGGGLPLLVSALACTALLAAPSEVPAPLLAGLCLAAAVSWRDDIAPLPARIRLPVHLLAAAFLILTLPVEARVFQGLLPLWADRALAIIALGWMMNLFNFMDGVNGIAGVEAASISAGYLMIGAATAWQISLAPLAAALLGATLGFLVWNLREKGKALVFMGDVGSVPLGFLTGAMMIDLAIRGFWAAALILPAYFLTDATLTLLMRLARGEKVWEAHKTHFYQRCAQALGGLHLPVVWRIAAANVSLIAAALWATQFPWAGLAAAAIVVGLLLVLLSLKRAG